TAASPRWAGKVVRQSLAGRELGYLAGAHNLIRLGPFLTLDDVELDFVTLFQALVAVHLNSAVVDKYIGSVVASDKPVPFRIVKPFDFAFVLSHRHEPSSQADSGWGCQPLDHRDATPEGLVFRA